MIDIEELKPIIEPLLTEENSTAVIESIMGIDKVVDNGAERIAELEAENERQKKEYDAKLREMFFSKGNSKEDAVVDTPEENKEEEIAEKTTFEELFEEG